MVVDNAVLAVAVLLMLLVLLYKWGCRNFDYWKLRGVPYLVPVPFLGNFTDGILMRFGMGPLLQRFVQQMPPHQPYFGIFILNQPALIVTDPILLKQILIKDFEYFCDHVTYSDAKLDPMGSLILFSLKNPQWRLVRKELAPVFSSHKLKMMHLLVSNLAQQDLMLHIKKLLLASHNEVDIREVCAKFSTDVIASVGFGIEAHCLRDNNATFRNISRSFFSVTNVWHAFSFRCYFLSPLLVQMLRLKFFPTWATDFLRTTFWSIMKQRKQTNTKRGDFVDIILQMQNLDTTKQGIKLSGDVLVSQAIQFFAAGFETVAATISYTLYELAKNQDLQDRLREEIRSVAPDHTDVTYDHIKNMMLLEQCVKETLRMYPVLPFLDRRCHKNYELPGTDVVIEKGIPIFVPLLAMHYDAEQFPNPHQYDPDRWRNDGNILSQEGLKQLPFGAGPRICIGARFGALSARLALVHILRNYTAVPSCRTPNRIEFDPWGLLLQPLNGSLYLSLEPLSS